MEDFKAAARMYREERIPVPSVDSATEARPEATPPEDSPALAAAAMEEALAAAAMEEALAEACMVEEALAAAMPEAAVAMAEAEVAIDSSHEVTKP
jgi:hypothetical protein